MNFGNMAKLMSLAKDLPAKMKKIKEELSRSEFSSVSAAGAVKATVNGTFELISLELTGAPDAEEIRQTINEAIESAKAAAQLKMAEATGGVEIPGLF